MRLSKHFRRGSASVFTLFPDTLDRLRWTVEQTTPDGRQPPGDWLYALARDMVDPRIQDSDRLAADYQRLTGDWLQVAGDLSASMARYEKSLKQPSRKKITD